MKPWQNKSLIDLSGEIWRPVVGFEERYLISNKGRVKSLGSKHDTGNNIITFPEKIRSISLDAYGYCFLNFSIGNKGYPQKVHRLVAKAFIPNPHNLETVNHIDFDRTNNEVNNLSWQSERDNYYYSVRSGRMINNGKNLPEVARRLFAKKVLKCSINGDPIEEYESINEAARQNGLCQSSISCNLLGRSKTSGGFVWKYA